MVLVDIFVPSIDVTYDFQLNDTIPIKMVIEEIAEMIGQKEQCKIIGDIWDLQLCEMKSGLALEKERSLYDEGVITGDRLILV